MQNLGTTIEYDYVILGGGCAGLQLANQIIWKLGAPECRQKKLRVLVLEARKTYQDDRTWCFWDSGSSPYCSWATTKFNSWSFSTNNQDPCIHLSDRYQYFCLKGIEFYQKSLALIRESPNVFIELGQEITEVKKTRDGFLIQMHEKQYVAEKIIDCRYRQPSGIAGAIWQIFYGYELIAEPTTSLNTQVVLMGDLRHDASGIFFNYLVPTTSNSYLLQTTYIGTSYFLPREMEEEVKRLGDRLFDKGWKIKRVESGSLLQYGSYSKDDIPGAIKGGSHWGALRISTGYAFSRIFQWSSRTANDIVHNKEDESLTSFDKTIQGLMDSVFLNLLRNSPDQVCKTLINFGEKLEPDIFARFMNDTARLMDFLRIIIVCPKKAMIRAAINLAFTKSIAKDPDK